MPTTPATRSGSTGTTTGTDPGTGGDPGTAIRAAFDGKLTEAGTTIGITVTRDPANVPTASFKPYVIAQGREGATMMRRDTGGSFKNVGFSADDHDGDCRRAAVLQHALARGEAFTSRIKSELFTIKNRIADNNRVLDGVVTAATTPGIGTPETQGYMLDISEDFTQVATDFNQKVKGARGKLGRARKSSASTVEQMAGELKARDAENQVLRGQSLTPADVGAAQPPKKGGRKTGRKTKR